ncbi:hypothetical protein BU25DRAFT_13796 [Macroventuria anomochaeta]|uniref:Uncharacterized protein n=1 Tax=Macroventuria anomochaeta TaxID=301207 RepID=A0ACB6SJK0_9PLEO|nr:uncharacterized protein BU25DRAFT_13796 [Macroventuria anomochaeta]KAF2633837.1 hypothetical protein BU25DRAFT_13796 [Macroventuria anomochaeta]
MQPTVGQRALSTLAKKLHPQLPLTPRESQQLLNLLTTSFRTHLDREHPVHISEKVQDPALRKTLGREDHGSLHAPSSAALASQHIDAVLSNPLFAVKPSRRGSESAASEILKDPMGWFLNQIASGSATLSKTSLCLEILDRHTAKQSPQLHEGKTPGAIIGDWLRSSGLDTSKEFLEMCIAKPQTKRPSNTFISRLVTILIADGKKPLLWKWFARPWHQGLSPSKALLFRQQLLKHMVHAEASQDLYRGIVLFRRAYEITGEHPDKWYEKLRPAGQYLVQAIMSKPTNSISHDLYNSFRQTTKLWVPGKWAQAVDSMLYLHHPTTASAAPGLRFIHDPAGAATYTKAMPSQRRFIVQLSLGVARQLLEEESYEDAQAVMAFTKQHFPDLVLSNLPTEQRTVVDRQSSKITKARREEERNLELLDGLVPT